MICGSGTFDWILDYVRFLFFVKLRRGDRQKMYDFEYMSLCSHQICGKYEAGSGLKGCAAAFFLFVNLGRVEIT